MFATPEASADFLQQRGSVAELTPQGIALSTLGLHVSGLSAQASTQILRAQALGCNLFSFDLSSLSQQDFHISFPFAADRACFYLCSRVPFAASAELWAHLYRAAERRLSPDLLVIDLPDPSFDSTAFSSVLDVLSRCEAAVQEGLIAGYGLCAPSLLAPRAEHLPLVALVEALQQKWGAPALQALVLPLNPVENGAWLFQNAVCNGKVMTPIELALALNMAFYARSPLMAGALLSPEPWAAYRELLQQESPLDCALQFARSVQGVTSVWMELREDVALDEQLRLLPAPRLSSLTLHRLLRKGNR